MSRHYASSFHNKIVCGRKNCGRCSRWRHITDFRAVRRDKQGEVIIIASYCNNCHRAEVKEARAQHTQSQVNRRRNVSRASYRRRHGKTIGKGPRTPTRRRPESVDRLPFARWLEARIKESSVRVVSERTGVPQRRIHAIINGYEQAKGKGGRKRVRAVDHVDLHTVDRALLNWGEGPDKLDELYPPRKKLE